MAFIQMTLAEAQASFFLPKNFWLGSVRVHARHTAAGKQRSIAPTTIIARVDNTIHRLTTTFDDLLIHNRK
jgi:hypothetical protein